MLRMVTSDTAKEGTATAGADVYLRIKENIVSNLYPAGVQFSETDLAAELGTSRTPVREAFIRLEAQGLVEILPRKGVRVLPVSATDMQEIYAILNELEALAVTSLAARCNDMPDMSELFDAMDAMEAAFEKQAWPEWAQGDDRFHREILRLSGNSRLIAITDALYNQAHRTQMITLRLRGNLETSNQEHRHIISCIEEGDGAGARNAMQTHRHRGGTDILKILSSYGLPPL